MKQQLPKEKRILKEERRLKKIFSENDGNKKFQAALGLIQRAAYMRITLEDYEEDILINGSVEKFSQSENQDPYDRKRPVVDLYNTMNTQYAKTIKQITDLLPENDIASKNELLDFINRKNTVI